MTKRELVVRVQEQFPGYRTGDIAFAVNRIFEAMKSSLKRGERIDVRDFGAFIVKNRKARQARNPRTEAAVTLKDRQAVLFKVGKELKERVAGKENV